MLAALACLQNQCLFKGLEVSPSQVLKSILGDFAGRCFADGRSATMAEPCAACVLAKTLAWRALPCLPAYAALVRECVRCDAQQRCADAAKNPARTL